MLIKLSGYFTALAAVSGAFVARFMLEPALGDVAQLLLFCLSVVVASWRGGLGPGLLATVVSVLLVDYFFMEPLYSFNSKNFAERIEQVLFLGIGISISILSQARLTSAAKLQQLLISEQHAREMAENVSRMKDEFLATLSHELRTPLTSIRGWAMLLHTGGLNSAQSAHALDVIVRGSKSQVQLIDDLLDVSRIITGKMRLDVRPLMLGSVIEAAIEAVRPSSEAKGIHLSVRLDPTAEAVSGDAERLQQVVWNLLSNAIKFTRKDGSVLVRLERVESYVQLTVADNGQGIKPEFLPYVFDRFRQEDSGSNRQQGGLGLGLAIVRHMVELHGGTVHAASEGPGKGAIFKVVLPIGPIAVSSHGMLDTPVAVRFDDWKSVLACGYTRAACDDDSEGCELVRPDILISDIGMPG